MSADKEFKPCPFCGGRSVTSVDVVEALAAFSKALSAPGGPSLAVQQHDPSWEAWKRLCDLVLDRAGSTSGHSSQKA